MLTGSGFVALSTNICIDQAKDYLKSSTLAPVVAKWFVEEESQVFSFTPRLVFRYTRVQLPDCNTLHGYALNFSSSPTHWAWKSRALCMKMEWWCGGRRERFTGLHHFTGLQDLLCCFKLVVHLVDIHKMLQSTIPKSTKRQWLNNLSFQNCFHLLPKTQSWTQP